MDPSTVRSSNRLQSLLRDPGYTGPVLVAFALGVALGVAFLALAKVSGWDLAARIVPPEAASPAWGPTRPAGASPPSEIQSLRLGTLLRFLGAVTGTAVLTAGLTVLLLSLGRAGRRRGELAIRVVLGAGRGALARLLAGEGLLIAGAGGLVGSVLGMATGAVLLHSWPGPLAAGGAVALQGPLLALALTVSGAAVLTLLPLLSAPGEGPGLRRALASGDRVSGDRPQRFLRGALVVAQLALSVTLLTAAGLLVRQALPGTGPGAMDPGARVVTAPVRPNAATPDSLSRVAFYRDLLRRAAELTTVEAESIASPGAWVGLGVEETAVAQCGACSRGGLYVPLSAPRVREHAVSPGYFETLGIEVLDGRAFTEDDGPDAPAVAVVSLSLARKKDTFQDGDPLGRRIQLGGLDGPWLTVVGVVEDVNPPGLGGARSPPPTLYVSAFQHPPRKAGLALRLSGSQAGSDLESGLRRAVARAGAGAWILGDLTALSQVLRTYRAPVTWLGWLLLGAGAFAFGLALYGLFAVTAYHVQLRRREIGIRMAVGADARAILGLVLGENLRLLAAGAVLGIWASVGLGGVLQDLGVPYFDPAVTGTVLAGLFAAGLAGSWHPARLAASVEPARSLAED